MALILNLETATRNCSVSLAKDGQTVAIREFAGEGYAHAEKLHVFIEEVIAEAGTAFAALNAVAVSKGPGSYTGLRIGVSAAKGLCYALNIPLIAVDTLELLARRVKAENGVIVPMIDARRMEVYCAVFDKDYNSLQETRAEIINAESFSGFDGPIYLCGDGAEKCRELLTDDKFIYNPEIQFPSAAEMSSISYDKHKKSDTVDVAYFEPYYLKDFIVNK